MNELSPRFWPVFFEVFETLPRQEPNLRRLEVARLLPRVSTKLGTQGKVVNDPSNVPGDIRRDPDVPADDPGDTKDVAESSRFP